VISPPFLRDLATDARSRVLDPPPWDAVVEDAHRLRLGALQGEAFTLAGLMTGTGLMTNEIVMASADRGPADVNESLDRLHLFEKYSPTTLRGVFAYLSAQGIGLTTNKVKGTLLELSTVDRMNDGTVPMAPGATHAELADSLNQPGWDIAERASDGDIVAHVQVKATEHWQPILKHLSRYPQYPDVATTHQGWQEAQAYAQWMLDHGIDPQHVISTGFDAQALTDHVKSNIDHLTVGHSIHEGCPEAAIIMIAAFVLVKWQKGENFKKALMWGMEQAKIAGHANLAGLLVQVITGPAALRPLAAIGTRFAFARGAVARETGETLRCLRATLRSVRESCDASGYAPWSGVVLSPLPDAHGIA
jgi:hypothetical protein